MTRKTARTQASTANNMIEIMIRRKEMEGPPSVDVEASKTLTSMEKRKANNQTTYGTTIITMTTFMSKRANSPNSKEAGEPRKVSKTMRGRLIQEGANRKWIITNNQSGKRRERKTNMMTRQRQRIMIIRRLRNMIGIRDSVRTCSRAGAREEEDESARCVVVMATESRSLVAAPVAMTANPFAKRMPTEEEAKWTGHEEAAVAADAETTTGIEAKEMTGTMTM